MSEAQSRNLYGEIDAEIKDSNQRVALPNEGKSTTGCLLVGIITQLHTSESNKKGHFLSSKLRKAFVTYKLEVPNGTWL